MARIRIIAVAALLLLPGGARADWSADTPGRIDALVKRFLTPRPGAVRVPALSLAIGIDGKLILAKGFGKARPDVPANERTVYHIGSLTKQFTAAAVLRLIETGSRAPLSRKVLTLDTPMRRDIRRRRDVDGGGRAADLGAQPTYHDVKPAELHVAAAACGQPMGRRRDAEPTGGAETIAAARLAEHVRIQQYRLLPPSQRS